MSSEKRLISSQPLESEVPPEKAGAMPAVSTWAITPIARTTCQSFSTRLGSLLRSEAICSMRTGSGTLEPDKDAVVADLAPHPLVDGDHAPRRHLGGLAGVIGLLKARRRRLDPEPSQGLRRHRAEALVRDRPPIGRRRHGASVQPLPHPDQPALAHDLAQCPADLVVAAEIAEIGAQEHVAALALDALQDPCFQRLGFHAPLLLCQYTTRGRNYQFYVN